MQKCSLIIDSCCDLPLDMVNKAGLKVIHFPYLLDGQEKLDDFYASISSKEFFDIMRDKKRQPPSTSQVPATVLIEAFREVLEAGTPAVYLSFSSALSGSFNTAGIVRDRLLELYPQGELYIVDTKLASIAEGLLVLGAIQQWEAGLSATELVAWVEEARWFVNAQFMVDNLDALQRGGRMPASVAAVGTKLDVKPLLGFSLDGSLSFTGVARGRKKGVHSLEDYFLKRSDNTEVGRRVLIGHADAPAEAKRFKDDLLKNEHGILYTETFIGPVIGSHVGPGMVACAFWGPDRREEVGVADKIARRIKEKE